MCVCVCVCVYVLEHECLYIYTWIIIIISDKCHVERTNVNNSVNTVWLVSGVHHQYRRLLKLN